jgi:uncharacterized protein YlxW (UPF0749 family)
MDNLEYIIQIISIVVFISGGITFFFKTGEYKTTIDSQLAELRKDTEENEKSIKELKQEIEIMKSENAKVITTLNSTLAEIKAKLELLVQYSGIFNGNNTTKK